MDYDDITYAFQDDIKSDFIEYWKVNKDGDETYEDIMEHFLEEAYNTIPLSHNECKDFINNNLDVYLKMDGFCSDYYENEFGEVWPGGEGLVRVVGLWKYLIAMDYLRNNYEEFIAEALAEDE